MFQELSTSAAQVVAQVQAEMADEGSTPADIAAVKFTGQLFISAGVVYFELSIPGSWDGTVYVSTDGRGSLEGSDVKKLREAAL